MAVTINGSTGVQLDDNDKQKFGTGNDLEIYHDGTNNQIKCAVDNQDITITSTKDLYLKTGDGSTGTHTFLYAADNAGVELRYDNVKQVETTSTGLSFGGNNATFADDGMIRMGTGNDLNLWHDGSDSYIENKTGTLVFQAKQAENACKMIPDGGVKLYYDNTKRWETNASGVTVFGGDGSGRLLPGTSNAGYIGDSSNKWNTVYAAVGTINTSDKKEKNTIVESDLGLSFVNKLKPVSYKFNGKTRTHYGLVAQDVETVLSNISKPATDFAGFIKTDNPDQLYDEIRDENNIPEGKKAGDVKKPAHISYGLRYGEFIAPLIKAVQELSAEVETLKTKVAALEAK